MIGNKIAKSDREPEPELGVWLGPAFAGKEDGDSTGAAGMDASLGISGSAGVLIVFLFSQQSDDHAIAPIWDASLIHLCRTCDTKFPSLGGVAAEPPGWFSATQMHH